MEKGEEEGNIDFMEDESKLQTQTPKLAKKQTRQSSTEYLTNDGFGMDFFFNC